MPDQDKPPFKLALRTEGPWWIGYVATADDPTSRQIELSRMRVIVAEESPDIKAKFIELNQLAVEHSFAKLGTFVEGWSPITAARRPGR